MRYYTGVGSRETPKEILAVMTEFAKSFAELPYWTLRSGGADGADSAFEAGADGKEIYLPWFRFNGNTSPLYGVCHKAMALAEKIHPNWNMLSDAGKKLHARNCYQVLGKNLDKPSEFLIYWTPGGEPVGGTRTALKLADEYGIPTFFIDSPNWLEIQQVIRLGPGHDVYFGGDYLGRTV